MSPEHLHLVLNHLPLAGAAFAALALLLGLLFRSPAACRAGMALALAATAVTPAVMETGEKARAAVALGAPLDPAAAPWLHEHEERAEALAPLLYATFLASAAALALSWRKPRWTLPLAGAALLLCLACLGAGAWAADAGGKVRHPEVRAGAPPPVGD